MQYYENFGVPQKATAPGRTITAGMATVLMNVGGLVAPYSIIVHLVCTDHA